MIIYSQETDDGLAEKISASNSISYASIVEPCDIEQNQIKTKSMAAMNDADARSEANASQSTQTHQVE